MAATDPNNVWVRRSAAKQGILPGKSAVGNPLYPAQSNRLSASSASASKSFSLGSGAFASFGSSAHSGRENQTGPNQTRSQKGSISNMGGALMSPSSEAFSDSTTVPPEKPAAEVESEPAGGSNVDASVPWMLSQAWSIWYRPPTPKNSDYEKSLQPVCHIGSAQDFWRVYVHLNRPSALPVVSDYHFFRDGVRPVWEDETNRNGGKWILRLKKGVSDRYWENILLALVGNDFDGFSEDVSGVVLSVRSGEDVLSVWTRTKDGKTGRVRDALQKCLQYPQDTVIVFKSHDDSIAQRTRSHRPSPMTNKTSSLLQ